MRNSLRRKRAILRDRSRGYATWELADWYGSQSSGDEDEGASPLIGPLTGWDLFMMQYGKTVMMVVDVHYRAEHLWAAEGALCAMRAMVGRRHESSALGRAMLPRVHEVRIEGWRREDDTLMFLSSDPDRPTVVYAQRHGGSVETG